MTPLPRGFACHVDNIGIKDTSDDLVVITTDRPRPAVGMFTKSRFAGPSVTISRDHLIDQRAQAVVIISKNANVANGPEGMTDAREVVGSVAGRIGCSAEDVLVASTGVIGRRYPMDRIRAGIARVPADLATTIGRAPATATTTTAQDAARGIMTTDTVAKVAEAQIGHGPARVVGIAKGVGMIEPDMATLIAVLMTDAEIDDDALSAVVADVVERSFNSISIDTDTSTSDTAIVLTSGAAGPVDLDQFADALFDVARSLARQIAADGEGAQTLIEVTVDGGRDADQAKRVAKSIVNSPLVKTAVHGRDPNWGRVAMAIGKCSDDTEIDPDQVIIRFGDTEVYPRRLADEDLAGLSHYLGNDEVLIHVSLQLGEGAATVWGCDLTDGYVRINADYTT
jgi:glutamate N-acetyltransferase/amino-acid N-acetyltransferase